MDSKNYNILFYYNKYYIIINDNDTRYKLMNENLKFHVFI